MRNVFRPETNLMRRRHRRSPPRAFCSHRLPEILKVFPRLSPRLPTCRRSTSLRVLAVLMVGPLFVTVTTPGPCAEPSAVVLPSGVEAVWDMGKAYHESTATRERICLNGLWQWQPAESNARHVPEDKWGYFKVPGCWPGITDYMQKDCQTAYVHPTWSNRKLVEVNAAWYHREFTVPKEWVGRRISPRIEYLNSYASVYVDSKQVGEVRFPGGELELPASSQQPGRHMLSLFVIAMPLKGVMLSYTDSASAREQKGSVARRGLCGDVYLMSTPPGPRLGNLRADTSVRKKEVAVVAGMDGLAGAGEYRLRARIVHGRDPLKEFTSRSFQSRDLNQGRFGFTQQWMPAKLWDIHTPQNIYGLEVSLLDGAGA